MALSQAVEDSSSLHNMNQHLSEDELEEAMKELYYHAPNEVKLEVTSNEKEFHYAFLSNQISDDNLQDNFKLAKPHQASGFQPDQTSKEVLHFLAKVMKTIEWPWTLCPLKTSPCKKPMTHPLPDVIICVLWGTIYPQEMPIFICEIIGSKDTWGKGSMEYKGWVATLKNLCFLLVTYYLEVRDIAAHLY